MGKRAVVVGDSGQDGTLLVKDLTKQAYRLIGIGRNRTNSNFETTKINHTRITNFTEVKKPLTWFEPHEIYYLAAHHGSSESIKNQSFRFEYEESHNVHILGLLNFLSAIQEFKLNSKLFYAASSLVFSGKAGEYQDESTKFDPQGIYGMTKAQGVWLCREFRAKYNMFVSSGILYNHESNLRPERFLTSKVIQTICRIASGSKEKLEIGDPSSCVDWGYAPDYVNAFQNIITLDYPDDFIIASGEAHSVEEFINLVFEYFELDKNQHLKINSKLLTRKQPIQIGNPGKLKLATGWKPSFGFNEFVIQLIKDHVSSSS